MTIKQLKKELNKYPDDETVIIVLEWQGGFYKADVGGVIEGQEWEEKDKRIWIYDNDGFLR